jgi:hypothetical protein
VSWLTGWSLLVLDEFPRCQGTAAFGTKAKPAPRPPVPVIALLSFAALAVGLAIAFSLGPR